MVQSPGAVPSPAPAIHTDPRAAYEGRALALGQSVAHLERRDRRFSIARGAVVVAGLVTGWLAFGRGVVAPAWVLGAIAAFVVLMVGHEGNARKLTRARRALLHYRRGLGRLDGDWTGKGTGGERFLDPAHPYAADLDLFGRGSLFELLCTARTEAGEAALARWLLELAPPDEVRARQEAIAELRERIDLREDLALVGEEVRAGLDPLALARWGEAAAPDLPVWAGPVALSLSALTVTALVAWPLGLGPTPAAAALGLEAALALLLGSRVERILADARRPVAHLGVLVALVQRLEQESFRGPRLTELKRQLLAAGRPASHQIGRLERLLVLVDSRDNQMFIPFAFVLLWSTQLALAIERWRRACGPSLGRWVEATGDLEALAALAGYAFENPDDPFPTFRDGVGIEAEGLRHPFLRASEAVANDVRLNAEHRLLVVSGSNMSGKSTYLRAIGVNAVLARAGAPVRARRLTLSAIAIGASIRVQDSLLEGRSRFYAEIRRIRQVLDLAHAPTLFLFDEVLHGTNSHDRRIGAEAVIRELLRRGAVGVVTTHDLALARIADELAPVAANAHFSDRLEGAEIRFDFRLRAGVVEHSNALALMRAVGIEVPLPATAGQPDGS